MIRLVLNVVLTAIALFAVTEVVPGVTIAPPEDPWAFLWVAIVFMLVNGIVGPVLRLVGAPLTLLTLGLFSLVINAGLFLLTAWVSAQLGLGLAVDGFPSALAGAVIMAIATWLLGMLTRMVVPGQ